MNLGLAAATFGLVVPAELPDKTFVSTIVLASRERPLPVWVGASAGLVVQAALGVLAGRLLALLPHRAVEAVVAGLFLAGAAYLLLVPERTAERKGAAAATRRAPATAGGPASGEAGGETGEAGATGEAARADGGGGWLAPGAPARVALMTFGVITLAEFGDLTQVIVANLTAHSGDPWSVFTGAAVAFVLLAALGVGAGRTLTRLVPLALVRRLAGVVLAGLGIWSLVVAAGA